MRLGFIIGFLIGAAVASLISISQDEDKEPLPAAEEEVPAARQLLERVRRQTRAARQAGREAAAEKEAEMLRAWEAARHRAG
jgi:hypothetical protein